MGFRKTATVEFLGGLDGVGQPHGGRSVVAARRRASSYYLDGARKLDVRQLLAKVGGIYGLSPDPANFLFEAIRANTTNAFNENNDGFHQSELLRFDVKLGMPVYMTYAGKPHHLNHSTANPKAARGVVIDVHYNDSAPALETCPGCQTKTAQRQNRDETGLHCRKCGTLVRDEFVETLVGIDASKDPPFAEGVRRGELAACSMGCDCLSTTCNVCRHVAYAKPEFCEHIRAGNKGTLWLRKGDRWAKTSSADIARELKRRKQAFVPHDFCYVLAQDFEARRAAEYCNGVIYGELSRVDQPADPKAETIELLNRAASLSAVDRIPTVAELTAETEQLLGRVRSRRRALEERMAHFASRREAETPGQFFVVRVNNDPSDTHAAPTLEQAVDMAQADPGSELSYAVVEAPDAGAARLMDADAWMPVRDDGQPAMDQDALNLRLEPGDEPLTIEPPGAPGDELGGPPGAPGAPPGQQSIDQYTETQMPGSPGPPQDEEMDLGEMGVLPTPPGASAPRKARKPMKFNAAYSKWAVQVSEQGNARLLNHDRVPLFVFQGAPADETGRKAFGREILGHLLSHGLVATAKHFNGFASPRLAQVVGGGMNDMQSFKDHHETDPLTGATEQDDMQGDQRGTPPTDVVADMTSDMAGDVRGTPPPNATSDGLMDHEREDQGIDSAVGEDHETMREQRTPFSMSDSVLDDEQHDHAEPLSRKKGGLSFPVPDLRVGLRVARRGDAKAAPWLVRSLIGSLDAKEAAHWGETSVELVAVNKTADAGVRRQRVAATDFWKQWLRLDQPAPGAPAPRAAAAEKCGKCGALMLGEHTCKTKEADGEGMAATAATSVAPDVRLVTAERMEKVASAKLAKAEQALAEAKTLSEAAATTAASASVMSFTRALRIAAARQACDLETSPLKLAAEAVLSEPRPIGRDAATGDPITYEGLDPELTRYLVAQIYAVGHADHIEQLMKRAAQLTKKGDQYLLDAEADLRNMTGGLPEITNARVAAIDEVGLRAMELRSAATNGNMELSPAPAEADVGVNNRRTAIRGALGGTLVGNVGRRLGLN